MERSRFQPNSRISAQDRMPNLQCKEYPCLLPGMTGPGRTNWLDADSNDKRSEQDCRRTAEVDWGPAVRPMLTARTGTGIYRPDPPDCRASHHPWQAPLQA